MLQKLVGNGTTMIGMVFVSVHSSELDRLAIDEENAILEFGVAKPDTLLDRTIRCREH